MSRKNTKLRKADSVVEMTPAQIAEFRRCARDPIYFIRTYIRVQHPKRGAIPLDLYDYQEDMIRSFMDNRYSIVLSARQTGKALDVDTPIATPDGFKRMGDIQPGDFVIGGDGKPTRVKWVSDVQHDRPCYAVTMSTGEQIIADADHQWVVNYERNRKSTNYSRTLTTQDMVNEGVLKSNSRGYTEAAYSIDTVTPLQLPEAALPIDPYVLGAWLGDGSTDAGVITSHKSDTELHDRLNSNSPNGINCRSYDYAPNVFSITVYGLQKSLRELGILGSKRIPKQYLRSSYQQRLALLQGLMDTDGYSGNGSNCEISLSNKELALDVQELICSLGLKTSITPMETSRRISYRMNFTAYKSTHPIFSLQRKLDTMKDRPGVNRAQSTKKRSIVSIEPVRSVPVKCIAVENSDHTYVVGRSFIKTHNSTVSAIYLLWYAMFRKDKTILIASNKNKGAMEMIQRIRFAYEELPLWLKPGVKDDLWNKHACGFDNGSRIESTATTESSGRGMSISLLFLDEFAFVNPQVQEEFWTSILPTLSTGGSCIMSSTPNGDGNLFAQLWRQAVNATNLGAESIAFIPIHVRWDQPPGRDARFKAQQIKLLGELKWRQEYECEFLSSDALLIDSLYLITMESQDPIREQREFKFWDDVHAENAYIVTLDPSTGSGLDYSVIDVYHFPSLMQIAQFRANDLSTPQLYLKLKWVLKGLENKNCEVYFTVENNGIGEGILALYEADENPPYDAIFVGDESKREGMNTQGRSKLRACIAYKELVESGQIKINSEQTIRELKTFVRKAGSYQAQIGGTDDCVSTGLLLVRVLHEISAYDEDAFDKMYRTTDSGEVYHITEAEAVMNDQL